MRPGTTEEAKLPDLWRSQASRRGKLMKTGNPHLLKEGREETPALAPGMGRFLCNTGRLQQLDLQALTVLAADVFHLILQACLWWAGEAVLSTLFPWAGLWQWAGGMPCTLPSPVCCLYPTPPVPRHHRLLSAVRYLSAAAPYRRDRSWWNSSRSVWRQPRYPALRRNLEMSKLGAWGMWIMKALGRTSSSYSWGQSSSPYHQQLSGTNTSLPSHKPPTPSASVVPGAPHPPAHPAP